MKIITKQYNGFDVRYLIQQDGEIWLNFDDFIALNATRN